MQGSEQSEEEGQDPYLKAREVFKNPMIKAKTAEEAKKQATKMVSLSKVMISLPAKNNIKTEINPNNPWQQSAVVRKQVFSKPQK